MKKRTFKKAVSLLLTLFLVLGLFAATPPLEGSAASQYITNIQTYVTASSVTISFHYGKNASDCDRQYLWVELYDQDWNKCGYFTFRHVFDEGINLQGDYTHTFTGLSPNAYYNARIRGDATDYGVFSDTNYYYNSDYIPVTTLTPQAPVFELEVSGVYRNTLYLEGEITSTGTGHTITSGGEIINPTGMTIFDNLRIEIRDGSNNLVYDTGWNFPEMGMRMFTGVPRKLTVSSMGPNPHTVKVSLRNRHGFVGQAEEEFRFFSVPVVTTDQMRFSAYNPTSFGGNLAVGVAADSFDELLSVTATRVGSTEKVRGVLDQSAGLYRWYFEGLAPGTSYFFQIDAHCASGRYENICELVYTAPAVIAGPTVSTVGADNIRPDGAKLSGEITANGNSNIIVCGFVYATLASGNDHPEIGATGVTQKAVALSGQALPAEFSGFLYGLTPGSGYYYRAYAKNSAGITTYGDTKTFATLAQPSVSTTGHSNVDTDSAELSGNVISTGGMSPTFRGFVLSQIPDPELGGAGVILAMAVDVSAGTGAYSTEVPGLLPDTTYYYRAYICNLKGIFYGAPGSFTTGQYENIPTVKLGLVSPPQTVPNEKEVNATFTSPTGVTVTATGFVYSQTQNPVIGGPGVTNVALGDIDGSFAATLTDLSPATTYYYKAYATDGTVTGYSNQGQFTTTAGPTTAYSVPVVTRTEVMDAAATTAIVETVAEVTGGAGLVIFSKNLSYSATNTDPLPGGADVTTVPAGVMGGSATSRATTTTTLTGLASNTTYYLRAVTNNPQGYYYGSVVTFMTDDAGLPVIPPTGLVTNITETDARIDETIDPNGAAITKYGVVYSMSETEPLLGSPQSLTKSWNVNLAEPAGIQINLSRLFGGVTYYYRIFAENSAGITYGEVRSFNTLTAILPVLTTSNAVTSGHNWAVTGISVISDGTGGEELVQTGVLVSTGNDPLVSDAGVIALYNSDTTLDDKFFTVVGLDPETDYYVRSFGLTIDGTVHYGSTKLFTTLAPQPPAIPVVIANSFLPVSEDTVTIFGSVESEGDSEVSERGFVYGPSSEPVIGGVGVTKVIDSTSGMGEFSADLEELEQDTVYYARAYAINNEGTAYSEDIIFMAGMRDAGVTPMIAVGGSHTAALKSDGTVWSWGSGTSGEMGNGSNENSLVPVQADIDSVKFIAAGNSCSYAIKNDGTLWAWGFNGNGELGIGNKTASNTPVQITALSDVLYVAGTSGGYALAVLDDGTVWAWGYNEKGQLGNNTQTNSLVPVQVIGLTDIVMVDAGAGHCVALKSDGTVWTWGNNERRQCARDSSTLFRTAGQVTALGSDNKKVIAGSHHTVVLKNNGDTWTFGRNQYGALGNGWTEADYTNNTSTFPTKVSSLSDILDIAAGSDYTAVQKNDGTIWTVGMNFRGVFADGNVIVGFPHVSGEFQMSLITGTVTQMDSHAHSVAYVRDDGTVWMCGANSEGQVGTGGTSLYIDYPTKVPGLRLNETTAPAVHTVTFNLDGGNWEGGGSIIQRIENGGSAIAPVVSGKPGGGEGHIPFTGWDRSFTNVTSDITVKALYGTSGTAPTITTTSMPGGTVGVAYSQDLAADGDTPITWGVESGSLPNGLSLSGATISGIPTASGTFSFTVKAENTVDDDTQALSIFISAAPSGGGGGGTPASPPAKPPKEETTVTGNTATVTTTVTTTVDANGKATAAVTQEQLSDAVNKAVEEAAKQGADTSAVVAIKVDAPAGAKTVEISIPKDVVSLAAESDIKALTVSTPVASISFDSDALSTIAREAAKDVKITASIVDASSLSKGTRQLVGDRPVFDFSVTSGGKTISQFGGNVSVAVPYTPRAGEDISAIVIYYINAAGEAEIVTNCIYDPATGTVNFITNHFSRYAVGYNKVSFGDVAADAWYYRPVSFIAARGITAGTGGGNYSPHAKLTRGQCIVLLMNAYGIAPDEKPADNFADAGDTWYTGHLAAAKRLGISAGVGNNMYAQGNQITRQEMFTLLYNALKVINQLPQGSSAKTLSSFTDAGQINSWAKEAMMLLVETGIVGGYDSKLHPTATTTRAEMAQVLYNLLMKKIKN